MVRKGNFGAALLGAAMLVAGAMGSAQAAVTTFDFTLANLAPSPIGNSKTFTSGSLSVTVTAWSFTGAGLTTLQPAALGQFVGGGLGVCNSFEGTNCSSPSHQVDNSGAVDFVLFTFNQLVDPTSITVDPAVSGSPDRDAAYWMGSPANTNLTGLTNAALDALFGGGETISDGSTGTGPRTITFAAGTATAILFGAQPGESDDQYKIESLTVNTIDVPEPMTLGLLGLGLAGLGAATRRRRSA